MEIRKKKIWIHKNEFLETLEVVDEGRLKYYSYTYRILSRKGEWLPSIRWDNWDHQSHVDKYDGNGALVEQRACPRKGLEEVTKLVKIFGRNLIAMDVSEL